MEMTVCTAKILHFYSPLCSRAAKGVQAEVNLRCFRKFLKWANCWEAHRLCFSRSSSSFCLSEMQTWWQPSVAVMDHATIFRMEDRRSWSLWWPRNHPRRLWTVYSGLLWAMQINLSSFKPLICALQQNPFLTHSYLYLCRHDQLFTLILSLQVKV